MRKATVQDMIDATLRMTRVSREDFACSWRGTDQVTARQALAYVACSVYNRTSLEVAEITNAKNHSTVRCRRIRASERMRSDEAFAALVERIIEEVERITRAH